MYDTAVCNNEVHGKCVFSIPKQNKIHKLNKKDRFVILAHVVNIDYELGERKNRVSLQNGAHCNFMINVCTYIFYIYVQIEIAM